MKLKTVATMSTEQVSALLATLPKSADIRKGETIVTVYAPNGKKVISAANVYGNQWHVMAADGLIQTN